MDKNQLDRLTANKQTIRLLNALAFAKCQHPAIILRKSQSDNAAFLGHFDHNSNTITLAPDNHYSESHLHSTLVHELVHALDWCTVKLNPLNPKHLACTEIRAAALSDDCSAFNELLKGWFPPSFKSCVKRRAVLALQMEGVSENDAKQSVTSVFEPCFNDRFPFDEFRWVGTVFGKWFLDGEHWFHFLSLDNGTKPRFVQGECFNSLGVGLFKPTASVENTRKGFVAMNEALKEVESKV